MLDATFYPLPSLVADKYYLLGTRLRSFREPLKEIVRSVMAPRINDNFRSGGNPPWTPLAITTKKDRAEYDYPDEPILVRSGLLRRTVGQLNIWNIDDEKAYIDAASFGAAQGGNAWYGLAQNNGFVGGYGAETPARPFLYFTDEDVEKSAAIMSVWLYEAEIECDFKVGDPV
jgi:phage gpG-like protein